MSSIAERVARGAALMDEKDPGWWRAGTDRAIDLDQLDLGGLDTCVLGQRCPAAVLARYCGWRPYTAYALNLSGLSYAAVGQWSNAHGFSAGDWGDYPGDYPALTAEWKRVITGRRQAP